MQTFSALKCLVIKKRGWYLIIYCNSASPDQVVSFHTLVAFTGCSQDTADAKL